MLNIAAYFLPLILAEITALIMLLMYLEPGWPYFRYRITDLWAIAISFTPTMLMIGYTMRVIDLRPIIYWSKEHLIVLSAVLGFSQFIGIVAGRIFAGPLLHRRGPPTQFESGVYIVTGAVAGCLIMTAYLLSVQFVLGKPL